MDNSQHTQRSPQWRLRLAERRVLVILGDFACSLIALPIAISFWASAEALPLEFLDFISERLQGWFFLLPAVWLILLVDSYDTRTTLDRRKTLASISTAAMIGAVLYMTVYFTASTSLPRRGVAMFLLASFVLTLLWRLLYIRIFTGARFLHRVLLVGAGVTGQALLEVISELEPEPFVMMGVLDDDLSKIGQIIAGYRVLGGCEILPDLIHEMSISDIIVAISGRMNPDTFQTLLDAQEQGIEITRMPRAYEELLGRVPVHYLEADWILRSFVDEAKVAAFYAIGKRLLDILGGLVGVLILLFIGPLISLAILLESGRPIVFVQERAGKGNMPFKILKFRTMWQNAEVEGEPQLAKEKDDRATKVGRFLRMTHLDEWLQFINVLRGEMSLVGPRPERPEFVAHFKEQIPFYRARLLTKPGIAGWAQIHFDYAATIEEMVMKLEYDLYYIKHRSIWMDIVIILRTVASVIGFRGR